MKHTLFGKSALSALLVTILVGTLVGCSESSPSPQGDTGTLQRIAVTSLPAKTTYTVGESLNLSGLVVTGTYSNGTTKQESVSVSNVSGYNTNTTGTQTLTVTVNGKTATFSVTVNAVGAATLQRIAITSLPTKTAYTVGDALDLSGLVVTGTYSDGTTKTETVSTANINGYNEETTGTQTLTVAVNGQTATFSVTVSAATLQSIEITSLPAKTTYTVGESLNLSGLVVTGTYSDGTTKTESVSTANINGYNEETTGTQNLTITVNGKTAQFSVTVNAATLQSIEEVEVYLTNAQGGATAVVRLVVDVNLGNEGWEALLSAINRSGRWVTLDVSACPMSGTTFDPGTNAGAGKVRGLVLPDVARSIKGGTHSNPTFRAFTSLGSISGASVETVGSFTFYSCRSLVSIDLPLLRTIPDAGSDLYGVFENCAALTSVSLPAATYIGSYAFWNCAALTSVSLPAATSIGGGAFGYCKVLESVSLPATPPSIATGSSNGIFRYTYYSSTSTIAITVPTGAVPAYISAWGVSASTSDYGNTDVYGEHHNAVTITARLLPQWL